jgi:3',5'-cyclic AMP phosphodiesterase CpdA
LKGLIQEEIHQMLGKNSFRKFITLTTLAAVWTVYSMVALAAAPGSTAEISVTGQVTVNGQTAISNSTIMSGSTIVTGADSSAIVSLGKTGRIEIHGDSNLNLQFSDNSIVGVLSSGKVTVTNAAGVAATMTTKDTVAIADAGQADTFVVEVECSHTHVDGVAGVVTMREGTNDKQIVAGSTATAGNLEQTGCKPCLRPNSAPPVRFAGPWWLILVAAGVAGVAIWRGRKTETECCGGGVIIVSPTR